MTVVGGGSKEVTAESQASDDVAAKQTNPVSKWFTHDWNRVIAISKLPMLRPATTIVALMPILQQLSDSIPISIENAWLLWFSSLAFAIAFIIVRLRAPSFIQDFADFGTYVAQGHSHRWILWRLKFAYSTAHNRAGLLAELVRKGLSDEYDNLADERKKRFNLPSDAGENGRVGDVDEVYQVGRDAFIFFQFEGRLHILTVEECADPFGLRQRELFWIIFTDQAKARPGSRVAAWILIYLAFALLACSFGYNVWKVATTATSAG